MSPRRPEATANRWKRAKLIFAAYTDALGAGQYRRARVLLERWWAVLDGRKLR